MKKIAFMFAAAAMVVACGNEAALTAEDSAAVIKLVEDSIAKEVDAVEKVAALTEESTAEDSAAYEGKVAQYKKDTAAIFATKEARVAAALTAALEAKKAGDEKKDSTENK